MSTTHRKSMHLAAVLVLLVWNSCIGNHGPVGVLAIPAFVVLGDSTVDVGVNTYINTIVKADWPPYGRDFPGGMPTGRFCDGKLVSDVIAELAGYQAPFQLAFNDPKAEGPVLLQGINTASSGSGFWDATVSGSSIGLTQQIQWVGEWMGKVAQLVGQPEADKITSEAIYVFSTGANDWLNNYYTNPILQQQYDIPSYQSYIAGFAQTRIQDLYNIGARKIVVVGLPPMGCVPTEMLLHNTGGKCIDDYNTVALNFNVVLQQIVSNSAASLPGSTFLYLDAYTQLMNAIVDPGSYGIKDPNSSDVCCQLLAGPIPSFGPLCNQASVTCENADEYLWWDSFHPTQFFNQKVGEYFYGILSHTFSM